MFSLAGFEWFFIYLCNTNAFVFGLFEPQPCYLVRALVVSEEVLARTDIPGGGGRGRQYLTLYCYHQNDFCIKMGSVESRFPISFSVAHLPLSVRCAARYVLAG